MTIKPSQKTIMLGPLLLRLHVWSSIMVFLWILLLLAYTSKRRVAGAQDPVPDPAVDLVSNDGQSIFSLLQQKKEQKLLRYSLETGTLTCSCDLDDAQVAGFAPGNGYFSIYDVEQERTLVFDASSCEQVSTIPSGSSLQAWLSRSQLAVWGMPDRVTIWEIRKNAEPQSITQFAVPKDRVPIAVHAGPENTVVIVSLLRGPDVGEGAREKGKNVDITVYPISRRVPMEAATSTQITVDMSNGSRELITRVNGRSMLIGTSTLVGVYDLTDLHLIRRIDKPAESSVINFAISSNGRYLAIALSVDLFVPNFSRKTVHEQPVTARLKVLDLKSRDTLLVEKPSQEEIESTKQKVTQLIRKKDLIFIAEMMPAYLDLSFIRDGRRLTGVTFGGRVRQWDVPSMKLVKEFRIRMPMDAND